MSEGEFSETVSPGVQTGVLAARMLEQACRDHNAARDERLGLYLESVGDLAQSIGRELEALDGDSVNVSRENLPTEAVLVSAALRAADLANLAVCALPELPRNGSAYLRIAAAVRLAAAATRSMALERRSLAAPGDYEGRDLRGAEWRASLASSQVEELLQEDA
jgi:signal transduction protein with GAF and PtsI domain